MAENEIYFQWQNEFLLKTIYPLRETKLRDFLYFFDEIDTWDRYKSLTEADIPGEIVAYCVDQQQKLIEAQAKYADLEAYFLNDNAKEITALYTADFPEPEEIVLNKIIGIHKSFKQYFPNYTKPSNQKYFLSARVQEGEELYRNVLWRISEKERSIRNNPTDWVSKPKYEIDIQKLKDVSTPMAEMERKKLYAFLAAYERLESYKAKVDKRKSDMDKVKQEAIKKVKDIQAQILTNEFQLADLLHQIERMRQPPCLESLKAYFQTADVSAEYRADFSNPDASVLDKIKRLHGDIIGYFPGFHNNAFLEHSVITNLIHMVWEGTLTTRRQDLARLLSKAFMSSPGSLEANANEQDIQTLRNVILPMLEREFNRLVDFQWAYEHTNPAGEDFSQQVAQKENEQAALEGKLVDLRQQEAKQLAIIDIQDRFLNLPLQDQILVLMEPEYTTVKDVVRWKSECYKQELINLEGKNLLERVVTEMVSNPTRYPLWLQYMVIHFSGMRYQSAHGSWADPKDLMMSLCVLEVQKEVQAIVDEVSIAALCEQKFHCYQAAQSHSQVLDEGGDYPEDVPELARATEPEWAARVSRHIGALNPTSGYYKRYALLHARIDEEEYKIWKYTDEEAREALYDWRPRVPPWLWNEIVRVTELRVTEVDSADWETASEDEQAAKYLRGMGKYRDIINEWKQKNLTAWREAHDSTDRLLVTRAVCNEVAEHIQHIRGVTPPGGLTAKPEWYLHKQNAGLAGDDQSYFRKLKKEEDIKPAASLFWTRWVNKLPNQWQITIPFVLSNNEKIIDPRPNSDGTNTVEQYGDAYRRTVSNRTGSQVFQTVQWLRWMHEATIITDAETVDGPTVLTFETALPVDDRRQATIGVTKHNLYDLFYNVTPSVMIGTFVGYTPEGVVPYEHLYEMLDWNHILRRDAYTPEQIETYWMNFPQPQVAFALEEYAPFEECQVEVTPALSERHWQSTLCYDRSLDGEGVALYQPEVKLRRGLRLYANISGKVEWSGKRYYPITMCNAQPRAQELLVRADEVTPVPRRRSTRPVLARKQAALYHITGLDARGRPRLEPTGLYLDADTCFRVSTIHPIAAKSMQPYLMISVCLRSPAAEGLFVRSADVEKMIERDYQLKVLEQLSILGPAR